jgi:hypothetical protein
MYPSVDGERELCEGCLEAKERMRRVTKMVASTTKGRTRGAAGGLARWCWGSRVDITHQQRCFPCTTAGGASRRMTNDGPRAVMTETVGYGSVQRDDENDNGNGNDQRQRRWSGNGDCTGCGNEQAQCDPTLSGTTTSGVLQCSWARRDGGPTPELGD